MRDIRRVYLLRVQQNEGGRLRIELREEGQRPRYFPDLKALARYLEEALAEPQKEDKDGKAQG